jgi:hypothetical protein
MAIAAGTEPIATGPTCQICICLII